MWGWRTEGRQNLTLLFYPYHKLGSVSLYCKHELLECRQKLEANKIKVCLYSIRKRHSCRVVLMDLYNVYLLVCLMSALFMLGESHI